VVVVEDKENDAEESKLSGVVFMNGSNGFLHYEQRLACFLFGFSHTLFTMQTTPKG
jgi:hypothetical protein